MTTIINDITDFSDPNSSSSNLSADSTLLTLSSTDNSSVGKANFNLTLILNNIYQLLTKMIGVMQNVTAVQAQRLNILTQWQAAYTDALSKVHTFTSADNISLQVPTGITGSASNLAALNQYTSNLITTLQGNRSAVSDDSKSLQSSVNSSNDAVTQQANLATSFLQELTTLLQAIYR